MVETHILGLASGLLASAAMYLFLLPLVKGQPTPPSLLVARLGRFDARSTSARIGGILLQAAFGAFWGLVAAYWNLRYYPVGGSYVSQGLLWGLAAFLLSVAGFVSLGLLGPRPDYRQWMGYLLVHLLFGAALGFCLVAWGPPASLGDPR